MQQREQRILKKLAEAREAQASAMSRFVQARARVMQVEARLQALRAHFASPPTIADQPLAPTPLLTDAASSSGIYKTDAISAAQVIIPPVHSHPTLAQTTDLCISADTQTASRAEQSRIPDAKLSLSTEQPTSNLIVSTPIPDEDEDEEETTKMPSLRLVRPTSSTKRNPDTEKTLLATLSTLPEGEQPDQLAANNETREEGATDSTAKLPLIRRGREQTQEPL